MLMLNVQPQHKNLKKKTTPVYQNTTEFFEFFTGLKLHQSDVIKSNPNCLIYSRLFNGIIQFNVPQFTGKERKNQHLKIQISELHSNLKHT